MTSSYVAGQRLDWRSAGTSASGRQPRSIRRFSPIQNIYPISFGHNGLHCLPGLNGATCAWGNFPQCLTARSALTDDALHSPPQHTRSSCLRPAAFERAFGYTRACSRSPIPRSPISSSRPRGRPHHALVSTKTARRRMATQLLVRGNSNLLRTGAYAFLNIRDPLCAWATYRGTLVCAPAQAGFLSVWSAGILRADDPARISRELILESIRAARHPERISRLCARLRRATRPHCAGRARPQQFDRDSSAPGQRQF